MKILIFVGLKIAELAAGVIGYLAISAIGYGILWIINIKYPSNVIADTHFYEIPCFMVTLCAAIVLTSLGGILYENWQWAERINARRKMQQPPPAPR